MVNAGGLFLSGEWGRQSNGHGSLPHRCDGQRSSSLCPPPAQTSSRPSATIPGRRRFAPVSARCQLTQPRRDSEGTHARVCDWRPQGPWLPGLAVSASASTHVRTLAPHVRTLAPHVRTLAPPPPAVRRPRPPQGRNSPKGTRDTHAGVNRQMYVKQKLNEHGVQEEGPGLSIKSSQQIGCGSQHTCRTSRLRDTMR